MQHVWLVQRLNAPRNMINPFVFGGGKMNGGINKESAEILKTIWSFDYMGSAEFEWGAVPTALDALLKSDLVTAVNDKYEKPIYIIAPKEIMSEVEAWVDSAANNNQGGLKERLMLMQALEGEKYAKTLGWLKIEDDKRCKEPFMFFIDKQMFEATCQLFGASIPETV